MCVILFIYSIFFVIETNIPDALLNPVNVY